MSCSITIDDSTMVFSQYCSHLEWYVRGEELHRGVRDEVEDLFQNVPEAEIVYVIFDGEFSYGNFWSETDDNGMTMYHTCIGNANYQCGTVAEMCEILYREHYLVEDGGQPLNGMRMTDVLQLRSTLYWSLDYFRDQMPDTDSDIIRNDARVAGLRQAIKTIDCHIYGNSTTRAEGSVTMQRVDDEIRKVYKRKGWL